MTASMTDAALLERLRYLERIDPGTPCRATELLREPDGRKRRRKAVLFGRAERGDDIAARAWRLLAEDLSDV